MQALIQKLVKLYRQLIANGRIADLDKLYPESSISGLEEGYLHI